MWNVLHGKDTSYLLFFRLGTHQRAFDCYRQAVNYISKKQIKLFLRTLSLPELFVRVRDVRAFVEDSAAVCERKNASCVFVRSLVVCENAPLSVCDACDDCDGEDERENVVFKTHFWKETRMIPSTGSTADIDINGPLNRYE